MINLGYSRHKIEGGLCFTKQKKAALFVQPRPFFYKIEFSPDNSELRMTKYECGEGLFRSVNRADAEGLSKSTRYEVRGTRVEGLLFSVD